MKFLVPNYSCLQIRGLPPPDPHSLCPLFSNEFVEPPPEKNSWVRHCSHMLPASVHSAFATKFYVIINLKTLHFGTVAGILN